MAKKTRDPKLLANLEHNDVSGTHKEFNSGHPVGAVGTYAAAPATEIKVGKKMPVLITNGTGATIYVAVGDTGLAAPTDAATGIMILANSVKTINTGQFKFIRFNAASAAVQYVIADDDGSGEA